MDAILRIQRCLIEQNNDLTRDDHKPSCLLREGEYILFTCISFNLFWCRAASLSPSEQIQILLGEGDDRDQAPKVFCQMDALEKPTESYQWKETARCVFGSSTSCLCLLFARVWACTCMCLWETLWCYTSFRYTKTSKQMSTLSRLTSCLLTSHPWQVGQVRGGCGGGRRALVQATRGLSVPAFPLWAAVWTDGRRVHAGHGCPEHLPVRWPAAGSHDQQEVAGGGPAGGSAIRYRCPAFLSACQAPTPIHTGRRWRRHVPPSVHEADSVGDRPVTVCEERWIINNKYFTPTFFQTLNAMLYWRRWTSSKILL